MSRQQSDLYLIGTQVCRIDSNLAIRVHSSWIRSQRPKSRLLDGTLCRQSTGARVEKTPEMAAHIRAMHERSHHGQPGAEEHHIRINATWHAVKQTAAFQAGVTAAEKPKK